VRLVVCSEQEMVNMWKHVILLHHYLRDGHSITYKLGLSLDVAPNGSHRSPVLRRARHVPFDSPKMNRLLCLPSMQHNTRFLIYVKTCINTDNHGQNKSWFPPNVVTHNVCLFCFYHFLIDFSYWIDFHNRRNKLRGITQKP
jgi:hypothetical protein